MAVESGEILEALSDMRADTSGAAVAPEKPQFSPLTAYELNGKKIEFRRVRGTVGVTDSCMLQLDVNVAADVHHNHCRSLCHSIE